MGILIVNWSIIGHKVVSAEPSIPSKRGWRFVTPLNLLKCMFVVCLLKIARSLYLMRAMRQIIAIGNYFPKQCTKHTAYQIAGIPSQIHKRPIVSKSSVSSEFFSRRTLTWRMHCR